VYGVLTRVGAGLSGGAVSVWMPTLRFGEVSASVDEDYPTLRVAQHRRPGGEQGDELQQLPFVRTAEGQRRLEQLAGNDEPPPVCRCHRLAHERDRGDGSALGGGGEIVRLVSVHGFPERDMLGGLGYWPGCRATRGDRRRLVRLPASGGLGVVMGRPGGGGCGDWLPARLGRGAPGGTPAGLLAGSLLLAGDLLASAELFELQLALAGELLHPFGSRAGFLGGGSCGSTR